MSRMVLLEDVETVVNLGEMQRTLLPAGTRGIWVTSFTDARVVLLLEDGKYTSVPAGLVELDEDEYAGTLPPPPKGVPSWVMRAFAVGGTIGGIAIGCLLPVTSPFQ